MAERDDMNPGREWKSWSEVSAEAKKRVLETLMADAADHDACADCHKREYARAFELAARTLRTAARPDKRRRR